MITRLKAHDHLSIPLTSDLAVLALLLPLKPQVAVVPSTAPLALLSKCVVLQCALLRRTINGSIRSLV
jgi:hypothetical protein